MRLKSALVFLSALSSMFIIGGNTKSFGVLLQSLKEQLDTDTWIIGSSISILQVAGCILAPCAGYLGRRFTTRYVAMFCGVMVSLSFISCSLATRPLHLILPFFVAGNGMRVIKVLAIALLAEHFHASFGQAIGVVSCGLGLGVMVMAPVTQFILDTCGLKGALILLGAVNAHLIVCGALLKPYSNVKPGYQQIAEGEHKGESTVNRVAWLDTIVGLFSSSVFSNRRFLCLLTYQAIDSFAYSGWIVYLVSLAESKDISPYRSAVIASVGGFGGIIGKIISPVFIDRHILPTNAVYFAAFLAMMASLVGHALLGSFEGLLVSSLGFGISTGTLVIVYTDCKTCIEEDKMTESFAWLEISLVIAGAAGTLFTGRMFDLTGSYVTSFLFLAAFPLVGLMILTGDYFITRLRSYNSNN